MIDLQKGGISVKVKNHRRAFTWEELDQRKGSPLSIGGTNVPWKDVQAKLDEAGIDLDSQEIQDKIAAQKQAIKDMEPSEEQKQKAQKRRELRSELSNASPTRNPELAKELDKIKQYLGLLDL